MRVVKAFCCAAVLTVMCAPGARADQWDKKTILTFSGPVQLPRVTLPAGTYVFKLADIAGNRHVVQVFDKAEKKIFATMLAVPNQRMDATDKPVVMFAERASGSPQAVKVWYYPGETIGNEFVYPKSQAMKIAKANHMKVMAMNDDATMSNSAGVIPVEMKSAALGHFDENGEWQNDADAPVVSPAPMVMAKAEPAPAPMMAKSPRKHLPRTASSLVLFELISGLSLAAGFSLRKLRTVTA